MKRTLLSLILLISARTIAFAQSPIPRDEALSVEIAGQGTPVVLVPGVLGSAYSFRRVVPALVQHGFRVAVVDPLAFGSSPHPPDADYSLTAQADRLARTLQANQLSHVILACQALSGSICYRLAFRHPQLVRALISINGGPAEEAGTPGLRFALRFAKVVTFLTGSGLARREVRSGLIRSSADPAWVTDTVVARYISAFGGNVRDVMSALARVAAAREPEQLGPNLHRISAPVMLLAGTGSKNPPISDDERTLLRREIPHFSEQEIPGAGQYIQEEQPQAVIDAIVRMNDLR